MLTDQLRCRRPRSRSLVVMVKTRLRSVGRRKRAGRNGSVCSLQRKRGRGRGRGRERFGMQAGSLSPLSRSCLPIVLVLRRRPRSRSLVAVVKTRLRSVGGRERAGEMGLLTPTGSRARTRTRTRTIEDAGWKPVSCLPAPIISPLFFLVPIVLVLRPYSRSEVIHRAGDESFFPAFERERPRIVNNFAASASSGYELSSYSEKMNSTRLSNLAMVPWSGNEY